MSSTTTANPGTTVTLPAASNQALGLGQFAVDFIRGGLGEPAPVVLDRTLMFFTDSVLCGLSAIALGTNAPTVLRDEATRYPDPHGVPIFGSTRPVASEKAIAANCAAVREWDANGTNFGYNPALGHTAGEFGHNDYYPVAIAAAQLAGRTGADALRGMILHDEIRGRLAEVFSLKSYKIDHVMHGAIASAATYGAMLGAEPAQIESAIGMVVAHYVPWRAIRAGRQLSDSKGASAAISTEAAVLSMKRSMLGFVGPGDIFRNPEAIFRAFEGPGRLFAPLGASSPVGVGGAEEEAADASPFDLVLSRAGDDFAVMGMHFKLGLYEHQSAGALHGLIGLLQKHRELLQSPDRIASISIIAYEPAFGIIGDPAKRDPRTRQSADHSMVYIIATTLRKALELAREHGPAVLGRSDEGWIKLMLGPHDYGRDAIFHPQTRALMEKISFDHGGPEYDRKYPDGIPTSVIVTTTDGRSCDSGLVMYPAGHARNRAANLAELLPAKWRKHGSLAVDKPQAIIDRLQALPELAADRLASLYDFEILKRGGLDEEGTKGLRD
ncbi:MAG: MmgE/PrpD family protein [Planctomycetota bacterium]|jgi:2-methylcitrate dehydratase